MRRYLALAVLLVAGVGALPAAADPVTTGRMAQVAFTLHPATGEQVRYAVVVTSSAAGQRIEVGKELCRGSSCDTPSYYGGKLPAGALTIDGSQAVARLRTTLDGRALSVDWAPVPPGTVMLQGLHGGGTDGDMAFTVYRADPAAAHLVLAGRTCSGPGGVGDEVRVEAPEGANGDDLPLSRLQLPSAAPTCTN